MAPVWFRLRAELRSRWRGWLGLAVLIGLSGGVVLAVAAGARRTETAYPRLLEATRARDLIVSPGGPGLAAFYDEVDGLPEVEAGERFAGVPSFVVEDSRRLDLSVQVNAGVDPRASWSVGRPRLLAGRFPRPDRPLEALANRALVRTRGLGVGSRVTLQDADPAEIDPGAAPMTPARQRTVTIVGVGLFPEEVVPISPFDSAPTLVLTPAYFAAHADPEGLNYDLAFYRLRRGADLERFHREVETIAARHPELNGQVFVVNEHDRTAKVQRSIRPEVLALWLFAVLAGATALLVVGQAVTRQVVLDAGDHSALRALGMTPAQLLAQAGVTVAAIGVVGAALAVIVAVALSPLMPIGPARLAEPQPGLEVNTALLALGFATIVALLLVVCAWPARRAVSTTDAAGSGGLDADRRLSRLAERAARAGLPAPATTGLRLALDPGRGRASVPVRSALVGTVVAVAAVAAAFTFGTNLQRLVATPSLYGRTWDLTIDAVFGNVGPDSVQDLLDSHPRAIAALGAGTYGEMVVDGRAVPAVGIDSLRGTVFPTLLEGRAPRAEDEIVLGSKVLRGAGRSVGQTVEVSLNGERRAMRIVGRAVFPSLGRGSFPPTGLGEGAAVSPRLLAQPPPEAPDGIYNFFVIRYSPDRRAVAGLVREVRAASARCPDNAPCTMRISHRPGEVRDYARVRSMPLVLAGLLVLLAVAAMGHVLVTSVRRRRRDLAVLKTLGFRRFQVSATVAWQATTYAAIALLVGLPLGLAGGRRAWTAFADQLGAVSGAVSPLGAAALAIPATLVLANLIALLPARAAARTPPALVLRTE